MSMNGAPDKLAYYSINRVENLEKENSILREALERIAYQHGSPNENIDYLAGIATEALQRVEGK